VSDAEFNERTATEMVGPSWMKRPPGDGLEFAMLMIDWNPAHDDGQMRIVLEAWVKGDPSQLRTATVTCEAVSMWDATQRVRWTVLMKWRQRDMAHRGPELHHYEKAIGDWTLLAAFRAAFGLVLESQKHACACTEGDHHGC